MRIRTSRITVLAATWDDAEPGADHDMELLDAMQRIAVECPSYGRPRITAELRRRGWR